MTWTCDSNARFCQSQICQAARPASSWPVGTTGKLVDVADWITKPNKIVVVYHWAIGFTAVLSAFVRFYELLSIGTSDRTVQCLVSTHTSPQSRAVLTSRLALTCLNSGFESIRCRASAVAKHCLLFAVLTSAVVCEFATTCSASKVVTLRHFRKFINMASRVFWSDSTLCSFANTSHVAPSQSTVISPIFPLNIFQHLSTSHLGSIGQSNGPPSGFQKWWWREETEDIAITFRFRLRTARQKAPIMA